MNIKDIKSRKSIGILCILASSLFFALMSFFVRLAGDLPTMQKAFFRNAMAAVLMSIVLLKSSDGFRLQKGSLPYLLLRSACGTIGIICNFYAIDHMNISDANMLNKLSPFFAIMFSAILLKERANRWEWGAVALAFCGALFVAKPSFNIAGVPALIGVLGGLGAGTAYTFVRLLGQRGERSGVIILFFSLFSSLSVLPFAIADYQPMSLYQFIYLLLAGCAATGGQVFITKAYTYAPAKEISVFDYSQVVFAAALGFIFLEQIPDRWSVLGYIIIIAAAVGKWYYNLRSSTDKGGNK